jgi:hypothetical protein
MSDIGLQFIARFFKIDDNIYHNRVRLFPYNEYTSNDAKKKQTANVIAVCIEKCK